MRQEAVITDPNRKSCGQVESQKKGDVDWARPKPEPKKSADVQAHYQKTVSPIELIKPARTALLVGIKCGSYNQNPLPSVLLEIFLAVRLQDPVWFPKR